MAEPLYTHDGELVAGTVVDRPNRFVVRVRFDGGPASGASGTTSAQRSGGGPASGTTSGRSPDGDPERVFLGDPGELSGVVEPGTGVLCSPVDDESRATDYDAVAADLDGTYVSLRAALANDLFAAALERDLLDVPGYATAVREPELPDHGRTDFRLDGPDGRPRAYVEVKSCTCVEDGVALFPDRPTERGRRHLRSLEGLVESGVDCRVAFVVQRPDVEAFAPYSAVDPEFADLLRRVHDAGVEVRALATAFDPPHYYLETPDLPVAFRGQSRR